MGDPSAALVGAPDPNPALPGTLCGMRKHTLLGKAELKSPYFFASEGTVPVF